VTDLIASSHVGWEVATVALALLLVAAVSRTLDTGPVTPAIVMVAIGLLVGPLVLSDVEVGPSSLTVRLLAEATLGVVLFSDAARIDLRALRRESSVPTRLLGVGLPLTIIGGTLAALALFGAFSLSDALILAVILAPTDAGLGSAVVTDRRLPQRVRQSLNVESGLNDGICVPVLLVVLATASGAGEPAHPAQVIAEEIGYGVLAGVAAGLIAGGIVRVAGARGMVDDRWRAIVPVAGAALAYGAAVGLGGSGFIAAFVAGTVYGVVGRAHSDAAMAYTEETGALLNAVTFFMFGAVLLGPALEHVTWQVAVYALVSLTVARMVPVAVALYGTRARAPTVAFLGWFGPRGLASIVFAVIVADTHHAAPPTILTAAYFTVFVSVLAHGLSAAPLVGRYASWYASAGPEGAAMEAAETHEHPVRYGAARRHRTAGA
jgi:NhaP-type Na+/H+ or K+/H+ antiporter